MHYDFLIVGAGLFGSVCARELTDVGFKCLVIDKRDHIGGNCATESKEGIVIYKYGAHIFHTNKKYLYDYLSRYTQLTNFKYNPVVLYKDKFYSFPINLFTLNQIFGVTTPDQAKCVLDDSSKRKKLIDFFYRGYSEKQWGVPLEQIPFSIIDRIPIRITHDSSYFKNAIYECIPDYKRLFSRLLLGVDVLLGTDYFSMNQDDISKFSKIIYTGRVDEFYMYKFGRLAYRGLIFKDKLYDKHDFQGACTIHYPDSKIPYTRTIEHKYFNRSRLYHTIVTYEYPTNKGEPAYPFCNEKNMLLYKEYQALAELEKGVYFGGRLGTYSYINMDECIDNALILVKFIKAEIEEEID